jgi:hypothetical protein
MNDTLFGDVIHHYSRAQAIADGVLVDVSESARELGFRAPVAVTAAVWARCVAWSSEKGDHDELGRLWDVVWMARLATRSAKEQSEVNYILRVEQTDKSVGLVALRLCIGPGDEGEPVITIMLSEED